MKVKEKSIIGGADGPTSFFIVGKEKRKKTLKQRFQEKRYRIRKQRISKSIKADAHTMNQVADYMKGKLGYTEINTDSSEYKSEYDQMRASFLMQYHPELLGDFSELPQLENHSEEGVKAFLERLEQKQKAATAIPKDLFDIDLHIYEKKEEHLKSRIALERNYEYIGGSASGSKRGMKKYKAVIRSIYLYYGVTQEDIDEHTKRFEDLVGMLANR